jgi:hypothetical protein
MEPESLATCLQEPATGNMKLFPPVICKRLLVEELPVAAYYIFLFFFMLTFFFTK